MGDCGLGLLLGLLLCERNYLRFIIIVCLGVDVLEAEGDSVLFFQ